VDYLFGRREIEGRCHGKGERRWSAEGRGDYWRAGLCIEGPLWWLVVGVVVVLLSSLIQKRGKGPEGGLSVIYSRRL
jgi:hypothetical protein